MTNQPFFSIIIPTYNRPERLRSCLGAIALLDYPRKRFEVIVVDDGSKKPLDDVVEPLREQTTTPRKCWPCCCQKQGCRDSKRRISRFYRR